MDEINADAETQTTETAADSEPLRNLEDLKRAIGARDKLKSEREQLKSEKQALADQLEAVQAQRQLDRVNAKAIKAAESRIVELEKELTAANEMAQQRASELEQLHKSQRMAKITDAITANTGESQRDILAMMIESLVTRGELNPNAEDPAAEGQRVRDALAAKHPEIFKQATPVYSATQSSTGRVAPRNARWHELTPEQQRAMSQDEFAEVMKHGSATLNGLALRR